MAKYIAKKNKSIDNSSNFLIYSMLTIFSGTVLGLIVYNTIIRSHYQDYQDYYQPYYQPYYGFMSASNQAQVQELNHFSSIEKKITELEEKLDKLIPNKTTVSMKSLPEIKPNSIMELSPAEHHDMKRKSFGMR